MKAELVADRETIAVISTAHITPDDNELFVRGNVTRPFTAFTYDGGIVMPLLASEVLTQRDRGEILDAGFSSSIVEIIMWAHQHRFAGVRLDRDGPVNPDLRKYDW